MALDEQVKVLLEKMEAAGGPEMHTLTAEEARVSVDFSSFESEPEEVGKVENRVIPGPLGDIPVRVYTPEGDGPFPALVYYHGGGWVLGDLDGFDVLCRLLTNEANCVVVSVDYRLAPEHKFPAAAEDAYAAVKWIVENGSQIDVDSGRVAVGGDSAGGNLTAVVSLMSRDKGEFDLAYQMLVYPVTNHAFDTDSYRDNAEGYFLTRNDMIWFWDHYLNDGQDGKNPYASPLLADDLSGLPPAFVITAGFDPLRDEGIAYAERLKEAGVEVEATHYSGMIHGFFTMPGVLDEGLEAVKKAAGALRRVFKN